MSIKKKDITQCISLEDYDYCKGWNDAVDAIGRCKDCMWSREPTEQDYKELNRDLLFYEDSMVCDFWEREVWNRDFCSYFDKREEIKDENN